MAKGRRLIQTQKSIKEVVQRISRGPSSDGGEDAPSMRARETAMPLKRPKAVLDKMMVLKSLNVNNHIEYRW